MRLGKETFSKEKILKKILLTCTGKSQAFEGHSLYNALKYKRQEGINRVFRRPHYKEFSSLEPCLVLFFARIQHRVTHNA